MSCIAMPMGRSFAAEGGECSSARTGFLHRIVAGIALAVSVLLFPEGVLPSRRRSLWIPGPVLPVWAPSPRRKK